MNRIGLDTDVLVCWMMEGADRHPAVVRFLRREVRDGGAKLFLVAQVVFEALHVVTDPRRFADALDPRRAAAWLDALWHGSEVEHGIAAPPVERTLVLLEEHRLGRKRILDTALAATLEAAKVRRLATFNESDYLPFGFLEILVPS